MEIAVSLEISNEASYYFHSKDFEKRFQWLQKIKPLLIKK
jgi:hypothetical protein